MFCKRRTSVSYAQQRQIVLHTALWSSSRTSSNIYVEELVCHWEISDNKLACSCCIRGQAVLCHGPSSRSHRHTPEVTRGGLLRTLQSKLSEASCISASVTVWYRVRTPFQDLQVTSSYTSELPGDPVTENRLRQVHLCFCSCCCSLCHKQVLSECPVCLKVENAFWSAASPTATQTDPYLVAFSQEMAEELELDPADITRSLFAEVFTGNASIPGSSSQTYAMRYGGHQFGSWAGENI